MARLEISLLGPFGITLDGDPATGFISDKVRALLAYLAVEGAQPQRREILAGLLWGGYPERSARASLRNALTNLRHVIGDREAQPPYLRITPQAIQLHPEGDVLLDVTAFTQAVGDAGDVRAARETGQLEAAVSLYQGSFLEGFSLADSPAFEEWALLEREQLQRQMLAVLQALVEHYERRGEVARALEYARREVQLEPYPEAAQRQLMRLLAANGQRELALAQYERYCRLLSEELGVIPGQETVGLYEEIRDGEDLTGLPNLSGPRVPPHNLPAQSTPFVGREHELAELDRLLADAEVRLVTVVGPGGMGKTRLALEVARRALDRYPAGAWLVDLAPLPAGASLPRATAAALGVHERPGRPLLEVIVDALQTRQLLLVLDNCEHLGDGVARLVGALLSRCPELTVLATSREPLHVPGEHLYDAPPMEVPPSRDLSGADTERPSRRPDRSVLGYDALQLFAQRATAVRPGFRLDEGSAPLAAEVCRRLDGMPLAIELAAARLRALSLVEVAAHLDDRFGLLTDGSRAVPPRQQTLRNTVTWSYDLLSTRERLLFDRLSVFAGSFSLAGTEAVCSGEGIEQEEVLELLACLVDQSLVGQAEGLGGTTRYRLLETLRAYGQERLAQRGETGEVAARHAGYYVSLAEATEPVFYAHEREMIDAQRRLDAEADNLAAAIGWALARRQPETAMRIGGALHFWTMYRPHYTQYAEWMHQALAQGDEVAPLYRAKAWVLISGHAYNRGRYEEGADAAQAGLASARAAGDPHWIARGLSWVAFHLKATGQREEARIYFEECRSLVAQCGDAELANCTALSSAEYEPLGRRRLLLEKILRRAPYASRPFGLQFLANAAQLQGDLKGAEAHLRESLAGWTEAGNVHMQGVLSGWLGEIHAMCGDYVGAERMLERGRVLARQIGHYGYVVWATRLLGHLAWRQGEFDTATSRYQEALELAHRPGYVKHAALAYLGLALVAAEWGEHERAEVLCAEAQSDLPAWDDEAQALTLSTRRRAALLRGDGARAVALYQHTLARARRRESRPEMVELIEYLAWALAANGQVGEAARLLALAEREREEMGIVLPPVDRPHHGRTVEGTRAALGEEGFAAAWAEGQARSLEATASELLAELEEL